uniref:WRKY domain-containing protein n=1 Tax=Kalanchoe fedtschenkoi TaxID=63787 RepID=A0A7N0UZ44_KALFE
MDLYSLQNPNPNFDLYTDDCSLDQFDFLLEGLSNYQTDDGFCGVFGESLLSYSTSPPAVTSPPEKVSNCGHDALLLVSGGASGSAMNVMQNNEGRKTKRDAYRPQRVAFKTKSRLDVLDDGYRWRKYGKKHVKNNPNLRNYYKCTAEGCQVKKIVERWVEDSSYVITQYVGVHTHESPSAYYFSNYNNHHYHHHHGISATDHLSSLSQCCKFLDSISSMEKVHHTAHEKIETSYIVNNFN